MYEITMAAFMVVGLVIVAFSVIPMPTAKKYQTLEDELYERQVRRGMKGYMEADHVQTQIPVRH